MSSPWIILPLKRVAEVRGGITKGRDLTGKKCEPRPYLRVANVQDGRLDLGEIAQIQATAEEARRYRLRRGDVLMNEGGDPDKLGRGCVWNEQIAGCLHQNHVFCVRPTPDLVPQWLNYVTSSDPAKFYFESRAKQTTGIASISSTNLKRLPVPLPSPSAQRAIADYLDRKTAAIDALIEKKQRLLDLLGEKRAALINRAVTKGLDPDVPMKDSGIPPLGRVPAHWRIVRNKVLVHEVTDLSTTGQEELLTVSHITGVTKRAEKNVSMFMAQSHVGYKRVKVGDLVINTMWAWMGALGTSAEAGIVSPAYGVYRLVLSQMDPTFYDYFYRTPQYIVEMTRHSKGVWTSRLRLYPEAFLGLSVVVPSVEEQRRIVRHIEQEVGRLPEVEAKLSASIDRLREYRQALITAAVTGQIEVPVP